MTRIKCRYTRHYCEYNNRHSRQIHSEYWWCDTNEGCDVDHYEKPVGSEHIYNPTCIYLEDVHGEFEKEVKSYSFDDGVLKVGRAIYYDNEIEYLEIDGRVLRTDQDERFNKQSGCD